jgi:SAM-dependent methyltransferase
MKASIKSPESYQSRFLEKDVAEDYANREYGAESYAASMWRRQGPLVHRLLREIQQRQSAGRHLDFACGTGRITRLTEDIFPEVDALDISPAMVEIARETCPEARFFVGNILEDPNLCPGPYASISTFRLVLNLDPPLRIPILKGLRQRIKPGGTLLLNLHGNRQSLRQPAIVWKRWRRRHGSADDDLMLNDMTREEVERCLDAAGFSVERVIGMGVLPPTVYRWPFRSLWARLDSLFSDLPFLQRFCIDLIFIAKTKDGLAA